MPRKARLIAAGLPHHVVQRGNRKMPVFFQKDDYIFYLSLIAEHAKKEGVSIWAWCLMENHVHFIVVPETAEALARMFREAHRRYTAFINKREGWTGHLWQDRFSSYIMDEPHALMAARYIENNPVAAGIAAHAGDYYWSSARYHLGLRKIDPLITGTHSLQELVPDWRAYLEDPAAERAREEALLLKHEKSGLPLERGRGKIAAVPGSPA